MGRQLVASVLASSGATGAVWTQKDVSPDHDADAVMGEGRQKDEDDDEDEMNHIGEEVKDSRPADATAPDGLSDGRRPISVAAADGEGSKAAAAADGSELESTDAKAGLAAATVTERLNQIEVSALRWQLQEALSQADLLRSELACVDLRRLQFVLSSSGGNTSPLSVLGGVARGAFSRARVPADDLRHLESPERARRVEDELSRAHLFSELILAKRDLQKGRTISRYMRKGVSELTKQMMVFTRALSASAGKTEADQRALTVLRNWLMRQMGALDVSYTNLQEELRSSRAHLQASGFRPSHPMANVDTISTSSASAVGAAANQPSPGTGPVTDGVGRTTALLSSSPRLSSPLTPGSSPGHLGGSPRGSVAQGQFSLAMPLSARGNAGRTWDRHQWRKY